MDIIPSSELNYGATQGVLGDSHYIAGRFNKSLELSEVYIATDRAYGSGAITVKIVDAKTDKVIHGISDTINTYIKLGNNEYRIRMLFKQSILLEKDKEYKFFFIDTAHSEPGRYVNIKSEYQSQIERTYHESDSSIEFTLTKFFFITVIKFIVSGVNKYLLQDKSGVLYSYEVSAADNLIPIMTGTNTPMGEVIYSTVNGSYWHYNAFNETTKEGNAGEWFWESKSNAGMPQFIGYKFESPTVVNTYAITPNRFWDVENPKNWIFQGSDDNTNWVDLHIVDGEEKVFEVTSEKKTYTFKNTYSYLYYRLLCTKNNGNNENSYVCIDRLEMYNIRTFDDNIKNLGTSKTREQFVKNGMNNILQDLFEPQDNLKTIELSEIQDLGDDGKIFECILDISDTYNITGGKAR